MFVRHSKHSSQDESMWKDEDGCMKWFDSSWFLVGYYMSVGLYIRREGGWENLKLANVLPFQLAFRMACCRVVNLVTGLDSVPGSRSQ
jgi:hypothetical protein